MPLALYDHLRAPEDGPLEPCVYRVVGRDGEDTVALLQVTDPAGNRVRTGRVVHAPVEEVETFEQVGNPDAGFDPRNALQGLYWTVRQPLDWLLGAGR